MESNTILLTVDWKIIFNSDNSIYCGLTDKGHIQQNIKFVDALHFFKLQKAEAVNRFFPSLL